MNPSLSLMARTVMPGLRRCGPPGQLHRSVQSLRPWNGPRRNLLDGRWISQDTEEAHAIRRRLVLLIHILLSTSPYDQSQRLVAHLQESRYVKELHEVKKGRPQTGYDLTPPFEHDSVHSRVRFRSSGPFKSRSGGGQRSPLTHRCGKASMPFAAPRRDPSTAPL